MLPILGRDGTAIGALDEFTEATNSVIRERRLGTVLELDERATASRSLKELWSNALAVLERNPGDAPFALLYSVSDKGIDNRTSPTHPLSSLMTKRCIFEGAIGVTSGLLDAFPSFDLAEGSEGLAPAFRQAWGSAKPIKLTASDGTLPQAFANGVALDRGFGKPCKSAVICAFPPLSGARIMGFLVLGLSTHRPYDDDYQSFIRLLTDRLYKSITLICLPEARQRSQAAAEKRELHHASLSKELLRRSQVVEKLEQDFERFAETSPIAFAVYQPDGLPIYMNQAYYNLNGIIKGASAFGPWADTQNIHTEDVHMVRKQWEQIAAGQEINPFEYRVIKPGNYCNINDAEAVGHRWLLAHPVPQLNDQGAWDEIVCWFTDITHQKYSELLQTRKLKDELESKEMTKNFIDM
ncbi:hypothetical protein AOQ84DRAFT_365320, partial [Glonium stellatum]